MKYFYSDEFLSQYFTFYPDNKIEEAFSVSVIGRPTEMALFDFMLRNNGLSHSVMFKEEDHDI